MSKIKILIFEHTPIFREGLCRLLGDESDLEVIAKSHDSEEAVILAKELMPDVAIIDAGGTKSNSIEVAKYIKEVCPNIAILMLSSHDWESYILDSVRVGVKGYLFKDIPIRELISAIRGVYAGEVVFDSKAASHILRRIDGVVVGLGRGFEQINRRELDVLRLVAKGMHNRNIAAELVISERTVQSHLVSIFRKLGVSSRTEAAIHALKEGLLDSQ